MRQIGFAFAAGLLLTTPSHAITAKEKMLTCQFGADDQQLKGKPRNAFLSRCMAKSDAPIRAKPKMAAPQ